MIRLNRMLSMVAACVTHVECKCRTLLTGRRYKYAREREIRPNPDPEIIRWGSGEGSRMSAEHPAIVNIRIRCAMDTRYFTLMPFGDAFRSALAAEPMRSEVDEQTDVPIFL